MIILAACTSRAPAVDHGPSVNPSSLYKGSGPSAGTSPSSTGSTAAKPVSSDDSSIPPGRTGELEPNLVDILDSMTPQQQLVVDTATYLEVKKCMADQGFKLLDPPPKLETPPNYGPAQYDAYIGILDKGYAEKYGYEAYTGSMPNEEQDTPQKQSSDLKYMIALNDNGNDGGCDAKAYRMIEKNVPGQNETKSDADRNPLTDVYTNAENATLADPKYKKVLGQWAQCMKKAGYDYPTPQAAFGAYNGFSLNAQNAKAMAEGKAPHPSKVEVDTAVTDAGCKQSSGLPDVYRTVFWGYQQAMVAKNRPALKPALQANAQELRNAQKMIKDLG